MLDRTFPLCNDQSIRFKLLPLQGFLGVDHLVRLGRVLDDPGPGLGLLQLFARLGQGSSQVTSVVASHRLLIRLKPDEFSFRFGPLYRKEGRKEGITEMYRCP